MRRAREMTNRARQGARGDLSNAHSTLVFELRRRNPHIKHAEACNRVNEALEKLLHVKMVAKHRVSGLSRLGSPRSQHRHCSSSNCPTAV